MSNSQNKYEKGELFVAVPHSPFSGIEMGTMVSYVGYDEECQMDSFTDGKCLCFLSSDSLIPATEEQKAKYKVGHLVKGYPVCVGELKGVCDLIVEVKNKLINDFGHGEDVKKLWDLLHQAYNKILDFSTDARNASV